MIIVKIQGGLGNQMFQYAYGRKLELSGKKVIFDVSFFNGNKAKGEVEREFMLDRLNLKTNSIFSDKRHLFFDIFCKIKTILGFKVEKYYQGEKYFVSIADDIKNEFVLKNGFSSAAREILKSIKVSNSVSLHIRRGDYITNEKTRAFHGVCSMEYYNKAIKFVKEHISKPFFFVFSDDIIWAKENFIGDEFTFVSSTDIEDIEELMLMSNCMNNIIANSSFSWWAAWLNGNSKKIVVAPARWLISTDVDTLDLLPKEWIKL